MKQLSEIFYFRGNVFYRYYKILSYLIFGKNKLAKLSLISRLKDYNNVSKTHNNRLINLHSVLEKIRNRALLCYDDYDYGASYNYQSFDELCLSGFRDTAARVNALSLKEIAAGKEIIDIGSNAGFLVFSLRNEITSAIGIEYNPYLCEQANAVADYLGVKGKCLFENSSFENYDSKGKKFDIVLSLANHSTYDGNTTQSLDDYFKKIQRLLHPDGIMIFESHPPNLDTDEKVKLIMEIMDKYFEIELLKVKPLKNFLDVDRFYVCAKLKS